MKNSLAISLLVLLALPVGAADLEHQASRDLVGFVSRAADLVAQKGVAACEAFKKEGGEWLGGDDYVFVLDKKGTAICHPNPSLEGRNLTEVRDPDGKPIMQMMLRQLERGADEGWVHYLWPLPSKSVLTWKSTYVREVTAPDGTAMVVGSGVYSMEMERAFVVDRVAEAVELIEADGEDAFTLLRDKAAGFIFYDAYVFVMSTAGVMLVNPASPELEGSNTLPIEDEDGVRPGEAMLELLATQSEGWVSYLWPRPGDKRSTRKEAFVRKVKMGDEELIVGAGVYFD